MSNLSLNISFKQLSDMNGLTGSEQVDTDVQKINKDKLSDRCSTFRM